MHKRIKKIHYKLQIIIYEEIYNYNILNHAYKLIQTLT